MLRIRRTKEKRILKKRFITETWFSEEIKRAVYCDTKSVIYVNQSKNNDLTTGEFLGTV
jgi:hypothetical protein